MFRWHCNKATSIPPPLQHFFVETKEGRLSPCVDYWGLNQITNKYYYPLPLVSSTLEQLRAANIFTKLDFRSTYSIPPPLKSLFSMSSKSCPIPSLISSMSKQNNVSFMFPQSHSWDISLALKDLWTNHSQRGFKDSRVLPTFTIGS